MLDHSMGSHVFSNSCTFIHSDDFSTWVRCIKSVKYLMTKRGQRYRSRVCDIKIKGFLFSMHSL
jgi:hypothetical protein